LKSLFSTTARCYSRAGYAEAQNLTESILLNGEEQ
jgi:hypothetical protein